MSSTSVATPTPLGTAVTSWALAGRTSAWIAPKRVATTSSGAMGVCWPHGEERRTDHSVARSRTQSEGDRGDGDAADDTSTSGSSSRLRSRRWSLSARGRAACGPPGRVAPARWRRWAAAPRSAPTTLSVRRSHPAGRPGPPPVVCRRVMAAGIDAHGPAGVSEWKPAMQPASDAAAASSARVLTLPTMSSSKQAMTRSPRLALGSSRAMRPSSSCTTTSFCERA